LFVLFFTLSLLVLSNALGAAAFKAKGFGLISFRRSMPEGRWRAPAARFSGPLAVYLLAVGLFTWWLHSAPEPTSKIEVMPGLPAQAAGLQSGDRIVEVNGAPVTTFPGLVERIRAAGPGASVDVGAQRGDHPVTARLAVTAEGYIGVKPSGELAWPTWGQAILGALARPFQVGAQQVSVIRSFLLGRISAGGPVAVGGPVATRASGDNPREVWLLATMAVNIALYWHGLVLFALASQVIAWARGEGRSPGASNGAQGPGGR
jgi:membrane-associated protease RseP (regulator of RpoE activity)